MQNSCFRISSQQRVDRAELSHGSLIQNRKAEVSTTRQARQTSKSSTGAYLLVPGRDCQKSLSGKNRTVSRFYSRLRPSASAVCQILNNHVSDPACHGHEPSLLISIFGVIPGELGVARLRQKFRFVRALSSLSSMVSFGRKNHQEPPKRCCAIALNISIVLASFSFSADTFSCISALRSSIRSWRACSLLLSPLLLLGFDDTA